MARILIVEDDEIISKSIKHHLEGWSNEVKCVGDFSKVMEYFSAFDPHIVLLDISLPFYNGFHWCTEIRKVSKVPIIFISSASDNMNIVMAVNMGGDDFIAKPFDLYVLTAKIQAMLRRTYDFLVYSDIIEYKGTTLNTADASFMYLGNKVELTKNEYKIILILMENRGRIVERDLLMKKLWETDSFVDENTLTVNINRLRRKLDEIGLDEFITTKKGQGYIIQ